MRSLFFIVKNQKFTSSSVAFSSVFSTSFTSFVLVSVVSAAWTSSVVVSLKKEKANKIRHLVTKPCSTLNHVWRPKLHPLSIGRENFVLFTLNYVLNATKIISEYDLYLALIRPEKSIMAGIAYVSS